MWDLVQREQEGQQTVLTEFKAGLQDKEDA